MWIHVYVCYKFAVAAKEFSEVTVDINYLSDRSVELM